MKIRLMTDEDLPAVLDAGAAHIADSNYAPMGFDREKAAVFITKMMDEGFAVVAVEGDVFAGAILGDVVQPWYSRYAMGIEHVLYVSPQFRGSRAALMLIRAWLLWCFESGAKQIRPGVSTGCDAAEDFYQRLGFKRSGALYVMDEGKTDD